MIAIERKKLALALKALKFYVKEDDVIEGMEGNAYWVKGKRNAEKSITAIKEALAQPEQEPVAKVVSTAPDRIWLDLGFDPQDEYEIIFHELHDVTWSQDNASGNGIEYVRADTTPPKRPWVGLTDDEIQECYSAAYKVVQGRQLEVALYRAIEDKLKELNT